MKCADVTKFIGKREVDGWNKLNAITTFIVSVAACFGVRMVLPVLL